MHPGFRRHAWLAPTALLLICVGWSLSSGTLQASFSQIATTLLGDAATPAAQAIVQIRLPRVLLGLLIGASLALCGCAMQALFRNPLAEPGLVGLSSGAALGAASWLVLGSCWPVLAMIPAQLSLPLAAFAGACLTAWLVIQLSMVDGRARIATLLLAGLAINAIAGAGLALLMISADNQALRSLTFWLFGSLGRSDWTAISYALPMQLAPVLLLRPRIQDHLNALLLGEAAAAHLGVEVQRLKLTLTLIVVAGVGAAVALAGIIGFVGLIVPHLVRLWLGPDHRRLVPVSALIGASLLIAADTLARTLTEPVEIPIGAITALVGGPFFLLLLLRNRRQVELG